MAPSKRVPALLLALVICAVGLTQAQTATAEEPAQRRQIAASTPTEVARRDYGWPWRSRITRRAGGPIAAAPAPTRPPTGAASPAKAPLDWSAGPVEAEDAATAARRAPAAGASGGAAAAGRIVEVRPSLAAGGYEVRARVQAPSGRIRLVLNGERVAEIGATGGWQDVRAAITASGAGEVVAVELANASGDVLVDVVSTTSVAAGLTVRGNDILDVAGVKFVPRGVTRTSLETTAIGWYWHWGDVVAMSQWGSNIVRVPLSQEFWLADSCSADPRYRASVDSAVDMITGAGMVALLDLHKSSRGDRCRAADQQRMADVRSVQFWTEVAGRYRDRPLVAFDLYNEPHDVSAAVWRDGGTVDGWTAAGMQTMYDAVRRTGARNLVFVSGLRWGFDPRVAATHPLDGYGIVYAAHVYSETEELTGEIDAALLGVAGDAPLVITEFGTKLGTGTYNARLIEYAERHGIGWIAYAWSAGDPREWNLLDAWTTRAPNAAGAPVFAALQSHRP